VLDAFEALLNRPTTWHASTPEQPFEQRMTRPASWAVPTAHTIDLAAAMFPELLYHRPDEIGVDFAVGELGLKCIYVTDVIPRPVANAEGKWTV
jgi:hypothetical protein